MVAVENRPSAFALNWFPELPDPGWVSWPVFWSSVVGLFLVIHTPPRLAKEAVSTLLQLGAAPQDSAALAEQACWVTEEFIQPARALVSLITCVVLSLPILRAVVLQLSPGGCISSVRPFVPAAIIFGLLTLFVWPLRSPALFDSMGVGYCTMASDPFVEDPLLPVDRQWFYRRFLKSAIAYFLQLRGRLLYFVFSTFCAYLVVVFSIVLGQARHGHETSAKPLAQGMLLLRYLSLATSSYIIYDFQLPGYADNVVFLLLALNALLPLSTQARLSCVALTVATHEASLAVLTPVILFWCSRSVQRGASVILFLYLLIWFGMSRFSPHGMMGAHAVIGGKAIREWVVDEPGRLLMGVFLAYKLLWLLPLLAVSWCCRCLRLFEWIGIFAVLLAPALVVFVAVDTSRLMGYGFLGILACLALLDQQELSLTRRRILHGLFLANLAVPSVYCGLNTGIMTFPGAYSLLFHYVWAPLLPC